MKLLKQIKQSNGVANISWRSHPWRTCCLQMKLRHQLRQPSRLDRSPCAVIGFSVQSCSDFIRRVDEHPWRLWKMMAEVTVLFNLDRRFFDNYLFAHSFVSFTSTAHKLTHVFTPKVIDAVDKFWWTWLCGLRIAGLSNPTAVSLRSSWKTAITEQRLLIWVWRLYQLWRGRLRRCSLFSFDGVS